MTKINYIILSLKRIYFGLVSEKYMIMVLGDEVVGASLRRIYPEIYKAYADEFINNKSFIKFSDIIDNSKTLH